MRAVWASRQGSSIEQELGREFPKGLCTRDDGRLQPVVAIVAHVEDRHSNVALPLGVKGTDFQRRMWALLQQTPCGETRSYGEIAKAMGKPSATRAVVRACAANKLAIVIPCHGVVRGDGDVGGYRCGLARERELIGRNSRPIRRSQLT